MNTATVSKSAIEQVRLTAQVVTDVQVPDIPEKVSELQNDAGYLTEHQSLEEYAKTDDVEQKDQELSGTLTDWVEDQNYLTEHQSLEEYAKTDDVEQKDQELSGTLTDWVEDQNYLTEHQDISNKVDKINNEDPIVISSYTVNEYLAYLTKQLGGTVVQNS